MGWTCSSEEDEDNWTDEEYTAHDDNLSSGLGTAAAPNLATGPNLSPRSLISCEVMLAKEVPGSNEMNHEAGPSHSKLVSYFIGMGFPEDLVSRAIKENGEANTGAILDNLLTYSVVKKSPTETENSLSGSLSSVSSGSERNSDDNDFSDVDFLENVEIAEDISDTDKKLLLLVEMGFSADEASSAIERCGPAASFLELADSIRAAQLAEEPDDHLTYQFYHNKKRKWPEEYQEPRKRGRPRTRTEHSKTRTGCARKVPIGRCEPTALNLPKPMVGFGLPTDPWCVTQRKLPEGALGPPFFYYENVAIAPKGVWETFSRFLYDIEPEFVDSKHFCAAARKRGYIHNLPIENRFPILPIPPLTVHEALPSTKKWWPSWDKRTKLNCLQTVMASSRLTERIRTALVDSSDPPPPRVQQYILDECRKWNLVWVGLHKVAPLEPDEVEMLLGFPKSHTRGGGISRTERYKSLGNSFQVDTVAYHLSVLKELFPNGIRVLSLFSGIGGAEVALHRLGIRLNLVVSVEISDTNRNIVRGWWEQTEQRGTLIHMTDVQQVNEEVLNQLISKHGGFDLVIGGSPCNNLAGSNRVTRDGLDGEHSSLFYDYFRILDLVKCIMGKN